MDECDQETGSKTKDSGTRKNRSLNRCVFATPDPHKVSAVGGGTSLPPPPAPPLCKCSWEVFQRFASSSREEGREEGGRGCGAGPAFIRCSAAAATVCGEDVRAASPHHPPLSLSSTQPHPAKALSRNNGDKGPRVLQRHKPRPPPPPSGAPAPS